MVSKQTNNKLSISVSPYKREVFVSLPTHSLKGSPLLVLHVKRGLSQLNLPYLFFIVVYIFFYCSSTQFLLFSRNFLIKLKFKFIFLQGNETSLPMELVSTCKSTINHNFKASSQSSYFYNTSIYLIYLISNTAR